MCQVLLPNLTVYAASLHMISRCHFIYNRLSVNTTNWTLHTYTYCWPCHSNQSCIGKLLATRGLGDHRGWRGSCANKIVTRSLSTMYLRTKDHVHIFLARENIPYRGGLKVHHTVRCVEHWNHLGEWLLVFSLPTSIVPLYRWSLLSDLFLMADGQRSLISSRQW